ncbi:MAG TPA: LLM class F420-dependent oxidoreductase [Micromonosporaceae bacterium]|nr:LLM class F420-dependent oxidoreductase [Micromonosporaceae bacterium]
MTQVCLFTEPHRGASYLDQLAIARRAEECGFDGFFRADHYQTVDEDAGLPGPTDSWLTLAALARETSRIRLGTLVTCVTFRQPGPLAVAVAQVDEMSGGRVELGIGAGWYEREHRSYGVPFPPIRERFDLLAEQLAIVTGLWRTPIGQRFSFTGQHYRLIDSPALPKPVQRPGPPIIVGGRGARRTPVLAARYADEFNVPFKSVPETGRLFDRAGQACERYGRTAAPLGLSASVVVACGRTQAEAVRRAEPLHATSALPPDHPVIGTPARVVDELGRFAKLGVRRIYLRLPSPGPGQLLEFEHLDLVAAEVLPQLR